jgi:membrane fusion protein, multidrug efflux system
MKNCSPFFAVPILLLLSACSGSENGNNASGSAAGQAGGQHQVSVGVVKMVQSDAPITVELPGRAVAFKSADIRPQVSGMIETVDYREGGEVRKGDLLFKVGDETYAAAAAEAEASLAKAEASVPTAQANFDRYQRLVTGGGATQIELDSAKVTLLQSKADVASAQAALRSAQIDLARTEIKAPFDGVADISAFSVGNLVTASQTTALTTVKQIDPIYVDLTDSSVNLLKFRSEIDSGTITRNNNSLAVRLTLETGKAYNETGTFDVPQASISETTGSFSVRVRFPNPEHLIVPGMFVRAELAIGTQRGFLLPQRAASRNSDGNLTARFITADSKVETRQFSEAKASGNFWLVVSGISEGDQLIVDGLQSISDGIEVKPVEVKLDADGVTQDAASPQVK